jgi:hypothetical protein
MCFQLQTVRQAIPIENWASYIGYIQYSDSVASHIVAEIMAVVLIALQIVARRWRIEFRSQTPSLPANVSEWPIMEFNEDTPASVVSPTGTFRSLAHSAKASAKEFGIAANYWISNFYRASGGGCVYIRAIWI